MKQKGIITTRKRKDGVFFLIAWCDADGVQRSETIRDDKSAAIPLTVIAEKLGHSDASVSLRTYAHAIPSQQSEAARVMDNLVTGGL